METTCSDDAANSAAADHQVAAASEWRGLEIVSIMARFIDDHKKPIRRHRELVKAVDAYLKSPKEKEAGWVTLKYGGPMNKWDVSKVKCFRKIFSADRSKRMAEFNQDISNWDVSSGTDFSEMFCGASKFNGNLSKWNVSAATDLSYMFYNAIAFTGKIGDWDVSNVTNMYAMFYQAISFNSDLSKWDVSKVTGVGDTGMTSMFRGATAFDGDLSNWDVSNVTDMSYMFYEAESFKGGSMGQWNVSNVWDMECMFCKATAFDCDLSEWNVSKVRNMSHMFYEASSFKSNLDNWDAFKYTDNVYMNMDSMFEGAILMQDLLPPWYHEYEEAPF